MRLWIHSRGDRRNPYQNVEFKVDFGFTREELDFRQEVEKFVRRELPPDWDKQVVYWPGGYGTIPMFETEFQDVVKEFNLKLSEKGWNRLAWPKEYGGEDSVMKAAIASNVCGHQGRELPGK